MRILIICLISHCNLNYCWPRGRIRSRIKYPCIYHVFCICGREMRNDRVIFCLSRKHFTDSHFLCCVTSFYLVSRCLMGSTDQACSSGFYFRISWILMEQHWFYFFHPLHFLQGLRSLKNWLLQKLSMKIFDQKFRFLIKK